MRFDHRLLTLALLLASSLPIGAGATTYRIDGGSDDAEVRFTSRASIESFDGVTSRISGWVEVDPVDLGAGLHWRLEVDMASLDTGIGLRNRHMRENHLHTEDFPLATFEGEAAAQDLPPSLPVGETTRFEVVGVFTLHGVERMRRIPVDVTVRADGSLAAEARFTVRLADHDIPRPRFLVLKLAEEQEVRVRFVARTTGENTR